MKAGTDRFLQSLSGTSVKTPADLVRWNREHPDLAGSKGRTVSMSHPHSSIQSTPGKSTWSRP
jgi:hypothetical protein